MRTENKIEKERKTRKKNRNMNPFQNKKRNNWKLKKRIALNEE